MGRWAAIRATLTGVTLAGSAPQLPRPQDDLFVFANQQWLRETPIPDDRVTYSAAAELVDRVEGQLRVLIEDAERAGDLQSGSEPQQIVDLYRHGRRHRAVAGSGCGGNPRPGVRGGGDGCVTADLVGHGTLCLLAGRRCAL